MITFKTHAPKGLPLNRIFLLTILASLELPELIKKAAPMEPTPHDYIIAINRMLLRSKRKKLANLSKDTVSD